MRSNYPHIAELGPGVFTTVGGVDEAIKECLPQDGKILSALDRSDSAWAHTGQIEVQLSDGSRKSYFIKAMSDDNGKRTMQGHYECSKMFHKIAPDFTPAAVGWGALKTDPNTYFFLQDFHRVKTGDYADVWTKRMAQFHRLSMEKHLELKASDEDSGKPKFGFHVPFPNANFSHYRNYWSDSWEDYFATTTRYGFEVEEAFNGPQPDDMKEAVEKIFTKVIPRILRPLETEGRQVKPCLLHGDMEWFNFVKDLDTGKIVALDIGCFWGHNEMDLRQTSGTTSPSGLSYQEAYYREFQDVSEPVEDFALRQKLYKLRGAINSSTAGIIDRQIFINGLGETAEICSQTYEEWHESRIAEYLAVDQSGGQVCHGKVMLAEPS